MSFDTGRKYDIAELYRAAFGYRGLPYPTVGVNLVPSIKGKVEALIDGTKFSDQAEGVAAFETPNSGQGTSQLGAALYMPVTLDDYQLPNEPVISVELVKLIRTTYLTGEHRENSVQKRGSVKELINTGDYRIKIRGIAINEDQDDYPESIMRRLRQIVEQRRSISIDSRITNVYNISRCVVENYRTIPLEGTPGAEAYEFSLLHDEDFETELLLR
jgi:hypothetical protein